MPSALRRLLAASVLAGSTLAASAALADETAPPSEITVSGNVALVSDYRFRGLSQSSGDPAVQGGITGSHASGAYAGVWASSTGFGVLDRRFATNAYTRTYGSMELDLFGGWSGPVGGGVTADVGLLYYAYPDGHFGRAEFFEPYASLSTTLGPVTGKLGVNYAWKQAALNFDGGGNDDNLYLYGELSAGIPTTPVTVSGHLGYAKGALSPKFATGQTARYDGGLDWNLGATFAITPRLSVGGQYVGVQGRSIDGYSNDTLVGTLKLSF
jgi:uncharacterized protein (TIGR02001 family)